MVFFNALSRYIKKLLAHIWKKSGKMEKYFSLSQEVAFIAELLEKDNNEVVKEEYIKKRHILLKYAIRVSGVPFRLEKEREAHEIWESIENGVLDSEFSEEVNYLKAKRQLVLYPYPFADKYHEDEIIVHENNDMDLCYVCHEGYNLYFPKEDKNDIAKKYLQLILEQDELSPHRYFVDKAFDCDVFVDVGSAEGIISLDFIGHAKELYLLEGAKSWVKALEETFGDDKFEENKIHIIKKYAGRYDDKNTITLDNLLDRYKGKKIVIKMDIEGMELDALRGIQNTMKYNDCYFSCATYHTNSAYMELKSFFEQNGYATSCTENYMLFIYGYMTLLNGKYQKIVPPYFRHGIIRAHKADVLSDLKECIRETA